MPKATPNPSPKLEIHTITAAGYSREIRLQRGPADQPHRLCLFLDGELYWREMDALPVLNALMERSALPRMTLAFISHGGMKARQHDYTCNEPFGRFMADTVMPWLQNEVSGLQSGDHLICGLSLSGLTSTYLSLQYPKLFSRCLSQSGSYWWNDQWLTKNATKWAPSPARFWLSVGDQETDADEPPEVSQHEGVNNLAKALKSVGAKVHYHEFHGGHDLKYWRAELDQALPWLVAP